MEILLTNYNPISKEQLKMISNEVRPVLGMIGFDNINQYLMSEYSTAVTEATGETPTTWKTFKQWKEEGSKVIKGSKAFKVWSAPKKVAKKDSKEDDKKSTYFFTCNLFCEFQVEAI